MSLISIVGRPIGKNCHSLNFAETAGDFNVLEQYLQQTDLVAIR